MHATPTPAQVNGSLIISVAVTPAESIISSMSEPASLMARRGSIMRWFRARRAASLIRPRDALPAALPGPHGVGGACLEYQRGLVGADMALRREVRVALNLSSPSPSVSELDA